MLFQMWLNALWLVAVLVRGTMVINKVCVVLRGGNNFKVAWRRSEGPSIKYVTLFLANFDPLPCNTFSHIRDPPESTPHISDPRTPPIFSRPSTEIPDKSPLYKFYLNCSRRFLSGGFVRVGFCSFPLLSQYICYNRKLNITLNFMFHM